jgi:hypothetical protein
MPIRPNWSLIAYESGADRADKEVCDYIDSNIPDTHEKYSPGRIGWAMPLEKILCRYEIPIFIVAKSVIALRDQ